MILHSLFLQNEYPSLENKTITNYDIAVFFLLPPQHIWASKVSVTLFSVGDYSTDSRKIKPMEVKKIGLNGWIFNWVVRRAV